jgi:hypothetical protein
MKATFRVVENPWTLIGACSLRERSHEQIRPRAKTPDRFPGCIRLSIPRSVRDDGAEVLALSAEANDAELDHLIEQMLAVAGSSGITKEVIEDAPARAEGGMGGRV